MSRHGLPWNFPLLWFIRINQSDIFVQLLLSSEKMLMFGSFCADRKINAVTNCALPCEAELWPPRTLPKPRAWILLPRGRMRRDARFWLAGCHLH